MSSTLRRLIKSFLERHLVLYCLYRVVNNRHDNTYLQIMSQSNKANLYRLHNDNIHYNKDRSVYLVSYEWEDNGFFAIMRKCLAGCVIAESLGMIPYIYVENSVYNVPGGYAGINNMFEYYYYPTIDSGIDGILENENCFCASYDHIMGLNRSLGCFSDKDLYSEYEVTDAFLERLAASLKKYFVLKDDVNDYIYNAVNSILGDCKVLGVHYRGTDYSVGMKAHPVSASLEQYVTYIDEALSIGYEAVFLATDDINALNAFKDRYGDRILFYDDVIRSSGKKGVHLDKHDRDNDQYYLGLEVLRDMYTLSECEGLVSGLSQVSIFARIMKLSCGYNYDYMKIIDNGINGR
ncbi:MAG: hypothetical protein IJ757_04965 [Clostridiales bacterium]|nr:hypothetical protein [Clostridiales bacterium]